MDADTAQRLYDACKAWVEKNQVDCVESIVQVDRITRALPDLAEIVCQHVGYYEYPDT